MKAHELAKQLLAGPDVEVWARNLAEDSPVWIEAIEGICEHGSCEDNAGYDEGDEPITKTVILLELREDDGFFI